MRRWLVVGLLLPLTMSLPTPGAAQERAVSFRNEILPLLARQGCSAASCHGSPSGKGGMRLSLWGLDPDIDYAELVEEDSGRRVKETEARPSLLLAKPSRVVEHKGGLRLPKDGSAYALLRDWIREGCPQDDGAPVCVGIDVSAGPTLAMRTDGPTVPLSVLADFDDGTRRDITHLAVFTSSNASTVSVTTDGRVSPGERGLAAVNVRYQKHLETMYVTVTAEVAGFEWRSSEPVNYVDRLVYDQLRQLRLLPAGRCTDAEFVRRVYLDVVGVLPEVERVREFLADDSPDKRARLIDQLLESREHAKFWAQRWGDLLQITRRQMGKDSALAYAHWLERAWAEDLPYDEFARRLITAEGDTGEEPTANFYRMGADHSETMEAAAVIFLGSRIQCAKCHNHPHEKWTQVDYHGMRNFFARVSVERRDNSARVVLGAAEDLKFPDSDRVVPPWLPGAGAIRLQDDADPRVFLADWLTEDDNPFFARVEVNRIWSYLLGAGIVEPFDDLRETNPPANPPLLAALAEDFVRQDYRRRPILRTILNSNTYQASVRPEAPRAAGGTKDTDESVFRETVEPFFNKYCVDCHGSDEPEGDFGIGGLLAARGDGGIAETWRQVLEQLTSEAMPPEGESRPDAATRRKVVSWIRGELTGPSEQGMGNSFFARRLPRRLSAEQVLDAVGHLTGVAERFRDVDDGTRATHLPVPDLQEHEFLQAFGQPRRGGTCSCDRPDDSNLGEALLMYNGRHVHDKLAAGGNRFRRAIRDGRSDREIVEELFLAAYCRPPRDDEWAAAEDYLSGHDDREKAFEDLCWALMTTSEFLTQH